jgi:formate dehydrogenase major subunit
MTKSGTGAREFAPKAPPAPFSFLFGRLEFTLNNLSLVERTIMGILETQTTCCYCGAGCQLLFTTDTEANRILDVHPVKGRTNDDKACLKDWYGWDFLNDPQILTKRFREPMIRKNGRQSPLEVVSWDEAITFVADNLKAVIKKCGPDSFMGAASARGPGNEPKLPHAEVCQGLYRH